MSDFKKGYTVEVINGCAPYFKKGDTAILLNSDRDENGMLQWRADFTISGSYYKNGHWWVNESAMKPIKTEKPEKPKFKAGDVVEIIEEADPYFKKGDQAILLSSSRDEKGNPDWKCDFTINRRYIGNGKWWVAEEDMKPIKKEKGRKLKPQYKIGDRVVVVSRGSLKDFTGVLIRKYPDAQWVVEFPAGIDTEEWILHEDEIRRDKEYKPEKGIRIEVEKIRHGCEEWYKVLSINALHYHQLPQEYINEVGAVWVTVLAPQHKKRLWMSILGKPIVVFTENSFYSKETFNELIEKIKKAGELLKEINQKRKWAGGETIII
jgi:hypothetical protein